MKNVISAILTLLCALPWAFAQSQPAASGHWEGTIGLPNKQLQVTVDLAQNDQGEWIGSLGFPELKTSDFALSKIEVKPGWVLFDSSEMLSEFSGSLSPDGDTLKGDYLSTLLRTVPVPMHLKRISEPKLKPRAKSTPIAKQFEGTWEGVAKFAGTWESDDPLAGSTVGFGVRLASGPDGLATGALTKLAEPQTELPLSLITQQGDSLRFEVRSAGAVYIGELTGQELVGEWRQFGAAPVALTFKRTATK